MSMPDLFQYLEYRAFLRDYYEERRHMDRIFSYRFFAGKLGMDASYLIRVMQEKKHLGDELVPKVISFLKFDKHHANYFENLVAFNKARTDRQARVFYDQMMATKGVQYRTLAKEHMDYFAKWYVVALRSLLDYTPFQGDYAALGKKLHPAISATECKQALFLLEHAELIRRTDAGYEVLDNHIHSGQHWNHDAIALFQEETLKLALRSLQQDPRSVRNISTLTMNISAENLTGIHELITQFQQDVAKLVEATAKSDRVYQLNMQLFPMSQVEAT